MIQILRERDCCGCGACSVACPQNCITMQEGTLGHLFPSIDQTKCINCGLCDKVCPMQVNLTHCDGQTAVAAFAKDATTRFEGSSGGMFGVFSKKLLANGYIVYGAAFNEDLKLQCISANTEEGLSPLCKSKYLQSDMTGCFKKVREQLRAGKKILFVSTPCQVYALKSYLMEDYPNLLTVDFFCHGVPSQRFFDQCLAEEEKALGSKILRYGFRAKKKHGATPHYVTLSYEKGGCEKNIVDYYFASPFYAIFQKYIDLRESCYNCRFAGRDRASDITIGDFHDIDSYIQGINRFDGVSTVVLNTPGGYAMWDSCLEDVQAYPMDLEKLISDGQCFGNGTNRPVRRDEFVEDYNKLETEELLRKWANPNAYRKQRIYYGLPKGIRQKLKKFMGV